MAIKVRRLNTWYPESQPCVLQTVLFLAIYWQISNCFIPILTDTICKIIVKNQTSITNCTFWKTLSTSCVGGGGRTFSHFSVILPSPASADLLVIPCSSHHRACEKAILPPQLGAEMRNERSTLSKWLGRVEVGEGVRACGACCGQSPVGERKRESGRKWCYKVYQGLPWEWLL